MDIAFLFSNGISISSTVTELVQSTVFNKKCVHEPPFQYYLSLLGGFFQSLKVLMTSYDGHSPTI